MKIVRVHEVMAGTNSASISEVFLGKTVVSCGVAQFAPQTVAHTSERHMHENDEVFIILSGEITVPIADGPTDIARTGDWVFVAAREEHHLTNHTLLPCTAMFIIVK